MTTSGNKTLRLLYPQWQGGWHGPIQSLIDLNLFDLTRGYHYGGQIISLIAPPNKNHDTAEVPISTEFNEEILKPEKGIYARQPILTQLKAAVSILDQKKPEKVIVIGGECSVSVAPFKYLAQKHENDIAMIWIDAHPDLMLPYEGGSDRWAFHEMPIMHIIGEKGDQEFLDVLPRGKIDPSKILYVGLRVIGDIEKKRIAELGLKKITAEEFRDKPELLEEWLKKTGCSKTVIHLDLDVLEPTEMFCAVGKEPNGMKIAEVVDAIVRTNKVAETVALTIAEHMPQTQVKLNNMMAQFPIFQ